MPQARPGPFAQTKDSRALGLSCFLSQWCSSNYNSCAMIVCDEESEGWSPPPIPAPSEWIYLNCYTLNACLLGLIKGRRKRRFFKSEAHYLFKLKRKITKILLHEFVYVEKTVFKSQRKSQVKKQDKYLRFQSRALVLFYKVIFPFSAYTPLRLLLLLVGRRHMHLNRDLKRPLQSTL